MIVVTGAGGAVGSCLLGELTAIGEPVRAAYHSPAAAQAADAAGRSVKVVDFDDPATLAPALAGAETLFLLNAMGPNQTQQELGVLAAAKAAGVRRVVKLSVWRADELLSPIARLHFPVEEALRSSGLSWTVLRPNFYMQNFSRGMADPIRHRGVFAQPRSDAAISYIDVRDVARVAARVLTSSGHESRTYSLTGPEALTYGEVASLFSKVLGRTVRYVGMSDEEARDALLKRGMPAFQADALIESRAAYREGGGETLTPTVAELTGRTPIGFEQFVLDHIATFTVPSGSIPTGAGGAQK